jgi:hypothetical protein
MAQDGDTELQGLWGNLDQILAHGIAGRVILPLTAEYRQSFLDHGAVACVPQISGRGSPSGRRSISGTIHETRSNVVRAGGGARSMGLDLLEPIC